MLTVDQMLQDRRASLEEALGIFDALEPVPLELMTGRWKGFEIQTGHPMDGLLEPSGWYGKLFKGKEDVHPLLFYANNKTALYSLDPKFVPLNMKFPKSKLLGSLVSLSRPVLETKVPTARMRMVEYRGKVTGTMVYDTKAIMDHFAKVNEDTLLGAMDLKGVPEAYIFVLERDFTEYKLNF